ncbi:AlkA N-terminal domain-containing protein [Pseudonocardia sp. TRM90224]|uniref:AlkA N-terminal domain-containing protein n=1 Tax=Pseudonocardia sp. TRM90224 TaxID=2812678 RepID=UPI001E2DF0F4|nr:AlkA N-terminal domain-containing protein [Pseudonocardia sp. TRM90224]
MTTYSAVVTTGIYCRPGCGARPLAKNNVTFELAAAAEAAGFRACLRCRPYRVAGPVSAAAPEIVCGAVQLIIDGALDEGTEPALAERVGLSTRHLRRLFRAHLGVSPDELARSRRAHFARRLLDDTDIAVVDVAFASGFGSLRQFNRTMREIFRASPTELRGRRRRSDRLVTDGGLALRLPVLPGYDWDGVRAILAARALPGVESVEDGAYRRTITVDGAPAVVEVTRGAPDHLLLRAHLPYWEGLIHIVDRVGRLLGLDTDPAAGAAALGALAQPRPGLVVPGAWAPLEPGLHALLGTDRAGAVVATLGNPVAGLPAGLTHTFPEPAALTADALRGLGLDEPDAAAVGALAAAAPELHRGTSLAALAELPGIAADLRHALAFRLGVRDAFPAGDPAVVAALADLELDPAWIPAQWRALAAAHLMAHATTMSESVQNQAGAVRTVGA